MATARLLGGMALLALLAAPRGVAAQCLGDCNGDGAVTVDELVRAVGIALHGCGETCPDCGYLGCSAGDVCIDELMGAVGLALRGCPVPHVPALLDSVPADGAGDVARSEWIRLHFASPLDRGAGTLGLRCSGGAPPTHIDLIAADTILLSPVGDLAPGATCAVTGLADARVRFAVAAGTAAATVFYDRADPRRTTPFPDDALSIDDTASPTGLRVQLPVPQGPDDLELIFNGLLPRTNMLDGFSPIAHFVVELSEAPDVATLPRTPAESLDPLATVGLYDLTPGSPAFGARVPFRLQPRTDTSVVGHVVSHTLLIFPSVPLAQHGRYGLIVTRRALAAGARPFDASPAFAALRNGAGAARAQTLTAEVIDAVRQYAAPWLEPADVALALRITVRTTDTVSHDLLAIKQQVLDAPPATYAITSVEPQSEDSPVAAIVRGTWQAPDWRDANKRFVVRDASGQPTRTGTKAIPFTLALPKAALGGPVPIAMYQHGNPGSSEREVPSAARRSLANDGFAVIGFTDVLNRELSAGIEDESAAILAQVTPVLTSILQNARIPEYWVETHGEMLAFLRFFDGLGTLDVLPIGAPDGVPDLDPAARRVYLGISEGANNGQAFLPFAPEIRAGALVVGGARLGEVLIHQTADLFINQLGAAFPSLTAADIWVGISLFQTIFDDQDPHNKVRFLYRDRLTVAGSDRKPSVLVLEGINDTLVPNHATDSMAWVMGPIPHVAPVQRPVPFLTVVTAPLLANIDAETTSGFYQYVPFGVPDLLATPGCAAQPEGHYCAQTAPESLHQRSVFFTSAVSGVPVIIDPFAEPAPAAVSSAQDEPPAR